MLQFHEIYQEAKDVGLIGAGKSLIKLFPVLEEHQQEIMQMPKQVANLIRYFEIIQMEGRGLGEGGDGEDEGEEDEDHVHCTTRTWK